MGTAQTLINCSGELSFVSDFLGSVAFYHGSELTSIAVDDKGIVQFDHKLLASFNLSQPFSTLE